jgi:hypothetical protein
LQGKSRFSTFALRFGKMRGKRVERGRKKVGKIFGESGLCSEICRPKRGVRVGRS